MELPAASFRSEVCATCGGKLLGALQKLLLFLAAGRARSRAVNRAIGHKREQERCRDRLPLRKACLLPFDIVNLVSREASRITTLWRNGGGSGNPPDRTDMS